MDIVFHEHVFPFQSLDFVCSTPFSVLASFPSIVESTSTLTNLPMDSSSSPVYHDSYFHDQHFAPNIDFDSNVKDDVTTLPVPVSPTQDTIPISTPPIESRPFVLPSVDSPASSGPPSSFDSPSTSPS